MFRKQISYSLATVVAGLALAACSGPGNGVGTDPFQDLPTPVAGVPAQGVFATSAEPTISVNGVPLSNRALSGTANLTESADGTISGHITVTGLDGNDYPLLLSGENDNGRITVPVTAFLCNREMNLTLYGTISSEGTITVAGGGEDLSCFGQRVTIDIPEFSIARQGQE